MQEEDGSKNNYKGNVKITSIKWSAQALHSITPNFDGVNFKCSSITTPCGKPRVSSSPEIIDSMLITV
jgi:hypothetical protein